MMANTMEFPCIEASRCYLTEKELGMRLTVNKTVVAPKTIDNNKAQGSDGGGAVVSATTRSLTQMKSGNSSKWGGGPNGKNTSNNATDPRHQPYYVAFDKGRRACDEWYVHLDAEISSAAHRGDRGCAGNGGGILTRSRVLQLRHCETGEYLCSDEEGRVGVSATPAPSTYWYMEPAAATSPPTEGMVAMQTQFFPPSSPSMPSLVRSRSVSSSSSSSSTDALPANRRTFLPNASGDLQVVLISKEHFPRRLAYTTSSLASILGQRNSSDSTASTSDSSSISVINIDNNSSSNDPACQRRVLVTTTNPRVNPAIWEFEFTSGELCFLSNPVMHCQVRCNLMGQLSLSSHFQGWEVFRFIEVGGAGTDGNGHVAISSWTHSHRFLSGNSDGEVYTVERRNQNNRLGPAEHWRLVPSPSQNGVLLQHVASDRYLSVGRVDQEALWTTTRPNDYAVWHLDAAHSHVYYLTSLFGSCEGGQPSQPSEGDQVQGDEGGPPGRRRLSFFAKAPKRDTKTGDAPKPRTADQQHVSSSKRGPFLTPNRRKWEEWRMERRPHDGLVTLVSTEHKKYLGCNSRGEVHTTTSAGPWCLWEMEESPLPRGGVVLRSREHQRLLAVDGDGGLCTTDASGGMRHDDDGDGTAETSLRHSWRLDPRLPPSMNAGKIAGACSLPVCVFHLL